MVTDFEGNLGSQQESKQRPVFLGGGNPDGEERFGDKFHGEYNDAGSFGKKTSRPNPVSKKEEEFWVKQNKMAEEVKEVPTQDSPTGTEQEKKPEEIKRESENMGLIVIPQPDYSIDSAKTFEDKWKDFWKSKPIEKAVEKVKGWFNKAKTESVEFLKKINDERQEKKTWHKFPQYGFADNKVWRGVSYLLGNITRKSKLPIDKGIDRPLALKVDRAEQYHQLMKTRVEFQKQLRIAKKEKNEIKRNEIRQVAVDRYNESKRKEARTILDEAHDEDRIYVDFLTKQEEIKVDMGILGEQMAKYVILEPKVESTEPMIVLIPGISNDVGLEELSIQYVKKGRRVMIVGYPESWKGRVTKKFGDKVGESDNFEPHTEFFMKAINQTLEEDTIIDMLGVSAGSLITANLVANKDFNKRINNATMIVPPGEINHKFLWLDSKLEAFLSIFTGTKKLGRLSVTPRDKIKVTQEHRDLMLHTFNALKKKLGQRYPWWEKEMYTGAGNKTLVIIGEKDLVTKAKKEKEAMHKNESLTVISFKRGNHSLPATKSKLLANLVEQFQEKAA